MFKILKTFTIVSLGVLVTGCQTKETGTWKTTVTKGSNEEKVHFNAGSTVLSSAELNKIRRLAANADSQKRLYARLFVTLKEPNQVDKLTKARLKYLKGHLKHWGVDAGDVDVVTYNIKGAERGKHMHNIVKVALENYTIVPPNCPGWPQMDGRQMPDGERQFGCATESNLVNMIADPKAFKEGRPIGKGDGTVNSLAIDKYHKGKTEKLKIEKIQTQ